MRPTRATHLEMETEGWLSPAQGGPVYVETNSLDYRVDVPAADSAAGCANGLVQLGRLLRDAAAEPFGDRPASPAESDSALPIPRLMIRQAD